MFALTKIREKSYLSVRVKRRNQESCVVIIPDQYLGRTEIPVVKSGITPAEALEEFCHRKKYTVVSLQESEDEELTAQLESA